MQIAYELFACFEMENNICILCYLQAEVQK